MTLNPRKFIEMKLETKSIQDQKNAKIEFFSEQKNVGEGGYPTNSNIMIFFGILIRSFTYIIKF